MKKTLAIILCLLLAVSLAACGASSKDAADINHAYTVSTAAGQTNDSLFSDEKLAFEDSAEIAETESKAEEKIIKTVELSVQTKEYDAYISAMVSNVTTLGGYIENSTNNMGSYYSSNANRNSTYIVRIPADKLDEFLAGAQEKGKITRKTENQQNVTLEYVDLESRISAYTTERATLTGLLEKAESLEDVLSIQERLSEVNYQIESYTAQMRVLENRIGYSTVTIYIDEVDRVSEGENSIGSRIKDNFLNNLDNLGEWISDFIVNFIGGLPILLPIAVLAVIAIIIIVKIIKKRKSK